MPRAGVLACLRVRVGMVLSPFGGHCFFLIFKRLTPSPSLSPPPSPSSREPRSSSPSPSPGKTRGPSSPRETKRKFFIRRVGAPAPQFQCSCPKSWLRFFPMGPQTALRAPLNIEIGGQGGREKLAFSFAGGCSTSAALGALGAPGAPGALGAPDARCAWGSCRTWCAFRTWHVWRSFARLLAPARDARSS